MLYSELSSALNGDFQHMYELYILELNHLLDHFQYWGKPKKKSVPVLWSIAANFRRICHSVPEF